MHFGKELNETRCAYYAAKDPTNSNSMSQLCGLFQKSPAGYDISASGPEATLSFSNSSTLNLVQLTDDQHAILVPAAIPPRIVYTASTIGVKSQCRSLTRQCLDLSAIKGSVPSFHCPGPSGPIVNNSMIVNGGIFGVLDASGGVSYTSNNQWSFEAATTNPFQFAALRVSDMFGASNPSQSRFVNDSGFFYASSTKQSYNLVVCEIAVRAVEYEYRDVSQEEDSIAIPQFRTQSYNMSDIRTTKLLATMLDTSLVALAVAARSVGAAIEPGTGFEDAFARVLSTSMVAAVGSIFEGSPAVDVTSLQTVLLSRIPLIPLVGFVFTVASLWLSTVVISLKAAQGTRTTPLTHLGQMSLVSPQAILRHFLPNTKAQTTWRGDSARLFEDEHEDDGLAIGKFPAPGGTSTYRIVRASGSPFLNPPTTPLGTKSSVSAEQTSNEHSSVSPASSTVIEPPIAPKQRMTIPLAIAFVSFGSLLLISSMTIFLLVYIFSIGHSSRSGGTLQTTANLSYVLATSQFMSTLMFVTVAPTMSLHAFHVAAVWADNTQTSQALLPSELCRLSYMVQGASLWSFVQQHKLKLKTPKTCGGRGPRRFCVTSETAFVLGCLLLTSNMAAVVDNWLHVSSSSFATTLYTQQTWSNMSTTTRIAMTQDQHAILVPAILPVRLRYQAATIGVQATCESITRRCVDNASERNQKQWSTWGVPWFDCPGSPPINIDNTQMENFPWHHLFGILNPVTGDIVDGVKSRAYLVAESSPIEMVMAAFGYAGTEAGHNTSYFTADGFTYSPLTVYGQQLLHCTVAINEVQYQYDDQSLTFTSLSTKSAAPQTIKMVMASSDHITMSSAVSAVAGALYSTGDYIATYERQLSSILLSDGGLAFSPAEAEKLWQIESKLGSQFQILPLSLFLIFTGLFCLVIVVILARTVSHWHASPNARMAQDRLTSPLPIVMQLFGPIDAMKPGEGSKVRRQFEELDVAHLSIGPLETGDGPMFTVYKAPNHTSHYDETEGMESNWTILPELSKRCSTDFLGNDDDRREIPHHFSFDSRMTLVNHLTQYWE